MNFDCAAYEQCSNLSAKHNKICIEYDKIEPQLVTIHKQMKSGEKIENCNMSELNSALHVFLDAARVFISAESTAGTEFRTNIGSVIDFLTLLKSTLNKIELAIDSYESGETTKPNDGITPLLVAANNSMREIGLLMQQFNAIRDDYLQKTLDILMEKARSSINHHVIENGPPACGSKPKSENSATTEN